MRREVFVEQMARLMMHFESELSKLRIDAYWEEMKFIPGKAFTAGVTKVIRTREYPSFPTTGSLLRASVGEHGHVVSARLPHGRDVQLDDIVSAYRERWQVAMERRAALPAPEAQVPATVDEEQSLARKIITEALAEVRLENARLDGENRQLNVRVKNAEALLQEQTQALKDYREEIVRQGKELARLERAQVKI